MSKTFEDAVGGEDNSITAAHEAGHALVAWLSPAIEAVEGVFWGVKDSRSSRASVKRSIREPATLYTYWENGTVLAAGMVAEIITHQRFQTGPCGSDLRGLYRTSLAICQKFRDKAPVSPWPHPPSAKVPPFGTYFEGGLEPGLSEVFGLCYLRARHQILSHRMAYGRLRVLLIEKMERSTAEISDALRLSKA